MKGFYELESYIKTQAVAHEAADETWEADIILLDTFREILRFAVSEGFQANAQAVNRVLNSENENLEDEEDDYTDWHFMSVVSEEMDEQIRRKTLPEKTEKLYKLWCLKLCNMDADFWEC